MKKGLLLLILSITIIIESCHVGTFGTWINGNIDLEVRTKLNNINAKLFKSLMSSDEEGVKRLMAPELIKNLGNKLDTIIKTTGNIRATDYKSIGDYYTKNSTTNISNIFPSDSGDNSYQISYLAVNKEMYASVLVSEGLPSNVLILAIYGKYDEGWKLNILQIGEYSILNKTASDFYAEAQKYYKKGNLIDASDMMLMASEIGHPGGSWFKYTNEDDMKSFYTKVLNEANTNYHFPITVKQVKTNPQIFSVHPQYIDDPNHRGIYPAIFYKSTIKLTDTVALRIENNAIQKSIGEVFNGVVKNNDFILYKAFNQISDGKTPVNQYGFIQKLK